jgi:pyruvate dehydrogenase E1 component alpha subunit
MIKSPYRLKKKFTNIKKLKKNFLLKIYKYLYLLRETEEKIRENYHLQIMKTPTHLGIGQEAISTGVCLNLKKKDTVFSHHRSHLPYLAKNGSVQGLFSELMGKKNGCSGGKGGSVHLTSYKNGFIGSTAILGQSLSLAVGSGLAHKLNKTKNISVAFFGNASLEEGSAYEALNFARLKNIPVLFIYENNFYSTEMPTYRDYMKMANYEKIVKSLNIKYKKIDGNNIADTYLKSGEAIKYIKKKLKPYFIEFITYRWLEHCGPYYDYEQKRDYRKKREIEYWKKACPVKNYKNFLTSIGLSENVTLIEKKIMSKINNDYIRSMKSKFPKINDLYKNIK